MIDNIVDEGIEYIYIWLPYDKIVLFMQNIWRFGLFKHAIVHSIITETECKNIANYLKLKYAIRSFDNTNFHVSFNSKVLIVCDTAEQSDIIVSKLNTPNIFIEYFQQYCKNSKYFWSIHNNTSSKIDFYLHASDSCNLGCRGCTHFSPLASKNSIVPLEELKNDLDLINKVFTSNRVSTIHILGGEPLLHPNIEEILKYCRNLFTDVNIEILSNGILLHKMSDSFFKTCVECKVDLAVSKYNIPLEYNELTNYVSSKGLGLRIVEVEKSINLGFRKTPRSNYNKYYKCNANNYIVIKDGKICQCFTAAYINLFNDYFNEHIGDKVELLPLENHTYYEVYDWLWKPTDLCRYCFEDRKETEWKRTNHNIEEWTCNNYENS